MKNLKILFVGIVALMIASCDSEPESGKIATGVIRYPSIILDGDDPIVISAGQNFNDPGAKAFLGTDDISAEMETESTVDANVPGLYQVSYTVTTINELDQESTVTVNRTVSVTDGDVSNVDISGTYMRDIAGVPTFNVIKIKNGVFQSENIRGSATFIFSGRIYAMGNNNLLVPITNSPFGRVQGAGAITAAGYGYTLTFLDPPNTGGTNVRNFIKQ